MIKASNTRQNRMAHCNEEETIATTNLSKLIHTVQNLPSDRYRANASSLWGLIDELESFEAPNMKEFVHSHKPSKKSFSRKYLDLRLYPSPDRSRGCDMKAHKPEKQPPAKSNTINKSNKKKKEDFKKGNKIEKNNDTSPDIYKEVTTFSKLQRMPDVENKMDNISKMKNKSQLQFANQKSRLKANSEETNILKNCINPDTPKNTQNNQSKISNPFMVEKNCEYKVLDKFRGFRNSGLHQNKVKSSNMFGGSTIRSISKETQIKKDQASMVKKLTSYWNNLLSNDIEESSSVQEVVQNINKSLQDIARSKHRNAKKSKNWMVSRTRSESSVNVLKNLDVSLVMRNEEKSYLNHSSKIISGRDEYKIFSKLKEDLLGDIGDVPENPNLFDVYKTKYLEEIQYQVDNEREIMKVGELKFDFKIQNAIEIMEKLVCKLKPFRNLSLTSNQVDLSHSLRTMLCLMTATMLSSEKQIFCEDFEPYEDQINTSDGEVVENDSNQTPRYSANEVIQSKNIDTTYMVSRSESSSIREENHDVSLVPVQGITQRKVEDALRYLTLWKDYLWAEFVLNPGIHKNGFYGWSQSSFFPQNFTFVIEEEIVLENSCSDGDDENYFEYDTEDDDCENHPKGVCTFVLDYVLNIFDRLLDSIFDMIILYWPESFQELVTNIYQAVASILVLWVITKEILGQ